MPITFTYPGTTPATVVIFGGPDMGDFSVEKTWMSPSIQAAGGKDTVVYDKGIKRWLHKITIKRTQSADISAFLTFLAAVDGISNAWDYIDAEGDHWLAHIWNSNEIRAALAAFNRETVTIEVFLIHRFPYLTDEAGNQMTDEAGNHLLAEVAI